MTVPVVSTVNTGRLCPGLHVRFGLCVFYRASLGWTPAPFSVPVCFTGRLWAGGQRRLVNIAETAAATVRDANSGEAPSVFVLFFGTGICKKKYPFKNWVSECTNPPPVLSKLKVHSRVTCRSSKIKYPFCKSVFGRNTFSTLTKWGEGWVRQKHEYRKGTFFCKNR